MKGMPFSSEPMYFSFPARISACLERSKLHSQQLVIQFTNVIRSNHMPSKFEGEIWENLGGSFDPGTSLAVVSRAPGVFNIFGLAGNSVWLKGWSDAGGWFPSVSEWENLGGSFDPGTSLAAVSYGTGNFALFGLAGNSVWHKGWSDAGGWFPSQSDWQNLGGAFDSGTSLVAISQRPGAINVFGVAGNQVWHRADSG